MKNLAIAIAILFLACSAARAEHFKIELTVKSAQDAPTDAPADGPADASHLDGGEAG